MFDASYKYSLLNIIDIKQGELIRKYLWKFKTKHKRVYHVWAEEYTHNIFIFKFHLAKDSQKKDKYNIVLNDGDAPSIIRTVLNILIDFYKGNPYASFGFIGAEKTGESKSNTQRFRVYSYITKNFFGDNKFYHASDFANSGYLLVNKKCSNPLKLMEEASIMFARLYIGLDLI